MLWWVSFFFSILFVEWKWQFVIFIKCQDAKFFKWLILLILTSDSLSNLSCDSLSDNTWEVTVCLCGRILNLSNDSMLNLSSDNMSIVTTDSLSNLSSDSLLNLSNGRLSNRVVYYFWQVIASQICQMKAYQIWQVTRFFDCYIYEVTWCQILASYILSNFSNNSPSNLASDSLSNFPNESLPNLSSVKMSNLAQDKTWEVTVESLLNLSVTACQVWQVWHSDIMSVRQVTGWHL